MVIARALFACVLAFSVALLPATLGQSRAAADPASAATSMAMDDCCPDPVNACDKAMNDCPSMGICVLKNVNLRSQDFSAAVIPLELTIMLAVAAIDLPVSHRGSPPLHPPQT